MDGIKRLMMRSVRDERQKMRAHWKRVHGDKDPDGAKQMPYKEIPLDVWAVVCDCFYSEPQQVRLCFCFFFFHVASCFFIENQFFLIFSILFVNKDRKKN